MGLKSMNRAFVSLYLIIVLSIVLLGSVLNKFWDEINPQTESDPAVVDLIQILENRLQHETVADKERALAQITAPLKYHFKLANLSDFSQTHISDKIAHGDIVNASDEQNNYVYKRIANSQDVLILTRPIDASHHNTWYMSFIILFYSLIALVIFLWVWPLARDLARLAGYTHEIGTENQPQPIVISSRSVVYPFAKAFNEMAKRLNDIMRSQKEMTYAVSHELRTPLARMKFALAITEEQELPQLLHKQLTNIHDDIIEMEALINSLLAYAAFEQQSQRLNQREGHIQSLLQDMMRRLGHQNPAVRLSVQDKTGGETFICEWSLMQTALQNLINNALSYAKSQVFITVAVRQGDFVIAVDDDGPGVSEDQRSRIFESFYRIYNEESNRSGFGLGLALVKRIMEWHSGSVLCCASDLGGARFELCWPHTFLLKK